MPQDHHTGNVIAVEEQRYAYQDCNVSGGLCLRAYPPSRGSPDEYARYLEYTLHIDRHTANSVVVTLRKRLRGEHIVAQRNRGERATTEEVYTAVMSFQDLANRLLGPGCDRIDEHEALPQVALDAMKGSYQ